MKECNKRIPSDAKVSSQSKPNPRIYPQKLGETEKLEKKEKQ